MFKGVLIYFYFYMVAPPQAQARWKLSTEARIVSIYCGIVSIIFIAISLLVKTPISTMMISEVRKEIGAGCYTIAVSFFLILSFKSSRSKLFIIPSILSIFLLSFIFLLIYQDPRYGFNKVKIPSDALPFCSAKNQETYPPLQENKYVVFEPTNTGAGSRILGLVSSYILAKVTGRELLVDWKKSNPPYSDFFTLIKTDEFRYLSDVTQKNVSEDEMDFIEATYCRQCSLRSHHKDFAILASEDLNKYYTKKYLFVKANTYFATTLLSNLNYRQILCNDFGEGKLFHQAFQRITKYNPQLQNLLAKYDQYFANTTVIGLQIRKKDRLAFPDERIDHFFSCAEVVASRYKDAKFFIVSDTQIIKNAAKSFFRDKVFMTDFHPHDYSETGIQSSFVEILLLARCKELIATPFSAFGSVAAGIGNIRPHYITRKEGYCIKDVTEEPKCSYWHALSKDHLPNLTSSDTINFDESYL